MNKILIENENNLGKYRLDLDSGDYKSLLRLMTVLQQNNNNLDQITQKSLSNVLDCLEETKFIKWSSKKKSSITAAGEIKTKQTKEKIENGIRILQMENKKITQYNLSKTSGVSYNSVVKYVNKERLEQLNKYLEDNQNNKPNETN